MQVQANRLLVKHGATLDDTLGMYHIGRFSFDTRKNNIAIYSSGIKIKTLPVSEFTLDTIKKTLKERK